MKLVLTATLSIFALAVAAQAGAVLSILDPGATFDPIPPTTAYSIDPVGGTFAIIVEAGNSYFDAPGGPSDLYGFDFDISFNPSMLQVISGGVSEDGYFAKNGVGLYSSVNNQTGVISYISDSVAGPGPGENLSFTQPGTFTDDPLVTILFKAVGSGESNINILQNSDLYFADSNGNFTTPIVGTDDVQTYVVLGHPAPTPEPGTAASMACAGILLVAGARLRKAAAKKQQHQ